MTPDTKTPLDGITTYTGETLVAALNALDQALPKGAYKEIKLGGRKFTDISPAYSLEVISEHFGPLGLGWGYSVEDEHTHDNMTADKVYEGETTPGKHYLGVTLRLGLWFVVIDAAGEKVRVEWQSYGGNANAGSGPDEHFSWQGALTNAIGKGWSMQGFQRRIYKGEDFTLDEKLEADTAAAPKSAKAKAKPAGAITSAEAKTELLTAIATAEAEGHTDALKSFLARNGGPNARAWAAMTVENREKAAAIACGAMTEGVAA